MEWHEVQKEQMVQDAAAILNNPETSEIDRLKAQLQKARGLWLTCKRQHPWQTTQYNQRTMKAREKAMTKLQTEAEELKKQLIDRGIPNP